MLRCVLITDCGVVLYVSLGDDYEKRVRLMGLYTWNKRVYAVN